MIMQKIAISAVAAAAFMAASASAQADDFDAAAFLKNLEQNGVLTQERELAVLEPTQCKFYPEVGMNVSAYIPGSTSKKYGCWTHDGNSIRITWKEISGYNLHMRTELVTYANLPNG